MGAHESERRRRRRLERAAAPASPEHGGRRADADPHARPRSSRPHDAASAVRPRRVPRPAPCACPLPPRVLRPARPRREVVRRCAGAFRARCRARACAVRAWRSCARRGAVDARRCFPRPPRVVVLPAPRRPRVAVRPRLRRPRVAVAAGARAVRAWWCARCRSPAARGAAPAPRRGRGADLGPSPSRRRADSDEHTMIMQEAPRRPLATTRGRTRARRSPRRRRRAEDDRRARSSAGRPSSGSSSNRARRRPNRAVVSTATAAARERAEAATRSAASPAEGPAAAGRSPAARRRRDGTDDGLAEPRRRHASGRDRAGGDVPAAAPRSQRSAVRRGQASSRRSLRSSAGVASRTLLPAGRARCAEPSQFPPPQARASQFPPPQQHVPYPSQAPPAVRASGVLAGAARRAAGSDERPVVAGLRRAGAELRADTESAESPVHAEPATAGISRAELAATLRAATARRAEHRAFERVPGTEALERSAAGVDRPGRAGAAAGDPRGERVPRCAARARDAARRGARTPRRSRHDRDGARPRGHDRFPAASDKRGCPALTSSRLPRVVLHDAPRAGGVGRGEARNGTFRGGPSAPTRLAFDEALELLRARRVAELAQRLRLDLTDALARDLEVLTDLFEGVVATSRRCRSACGGPSPRAASASSGPCGSAPRGSC